VSTSWLYIGRHPRFGRLINSQSVNCPRMVKLRAIRNVYTVDLARAPLTLHKVPVAQE
jgi:hypothetical protein